MLDHRLQLQVAELVQPKGRGEVLPHVGVRPHGRRAADADDAAITAGRVPLAGPDLAVEITELGVPAKDGPCRRRLGVQNAAISGRSARLSGCVADRFRPGNQSTGGKRSPRRALRISQMQMLSLHAAAEREPDVAAGASVIPFGLFVSTLMDACVGYLTAPVSPETKRFLTDVDGAPASAPIRLV